MGYEIEDLFDEVCLITDEYSEDKNFYLEIRK
jgi:hypothetical protein